MLSKENKKFDCFALNYFRILFLIWNEIQIWRIFSLSNLDLSFLFFRILYFHFGCEVWAKIFEGNYYFISFIPKFTQIMNMKNDNQKMILKKIITERWSSTGSQLFMLLFCMIEISKRRGKRTIKHSIVQKYIKFKYIFLLTRENSKISSFS